MSREDYDGATHRNLWVDAFWTPGMSVRVSICAGDSALVIGRNILAALASRGVADVDPPGARLRPETATQVWHLAVSPGKSRCGAYRPNEGLTFVETHVTCEHCLNGPVQRAMGACEPAADASLASDYDRGLATAERIVRGAASAALKKSKYATTEVSEALFDVADQIGASILQAPSTRDRSPEPSPLPGLRPQKPGRSESWMHPLAAVQHCYPYCLDSDGRAAPHEVKHFVWKIAKQAGKGNWWNTLSLIVDLHERALMHCREQARHTSATAKEGT